MRRREQELLNKIKEQQKALETMKQEKLKVRVLHLRALHWLDQVSSKFENIDVDIIFLSEVSKVMWEI